MTSRLVLAFVCACCSAAFSQTKPGTAPAPVKPFEGRQVIRVTCRTGMELAAVERMSETVWSCNPGVGPVDVQVTPAQREAIEKLGLPTRVLIADVQSLVDAEAAQIAQTRAQADAAWFATFRTLDEINARLDHYLANYGALVEPASAGETLEGRTIRAIKVSAPDLPGNPRASRPQVMFEGTQHAREWISPMTVMFIADSLIEGYPADQRARDALERFEIIFVPVINADGYAYTWASQANRMWRKNRRNNGNGTFGVDTNRNWGFQWGGEGASTQTSSETYRGTAAFSEPETQALSSFIASFPRLKGHIDFHSYSQLLLSPWGYTITLPPDAGFFDYMNPRITQALGFNGMTYVGGPTYTTIYPASGVVCDWVYGALDVPSWCIELRDRGQFGFVLPADQIIPTGQENLEAIHTFLGLLSEPLYLAPNQAPPDVLESGASWSIDFTARPGSQALAGPPSALVREHGGDFTPVPVSNLGGNLYRAQMPPTACGESIDYYLEATSAGGVTLRYPTGAPASLLSATGLNTSVSFDDTLEIASGWTVGAPGDNATAGLWERANPQGTAAQPEDDHTPDPGVLCWVTGASAGASIGANDVDGGTTTLTSPVFSALPPPASVLNSATLSMWYWYSNNQGSNPGQDSMLIEVSNDGGNTWFLADTINTNNSAWTYLPISLVGDFTPTGFMRVRILARDLGGGSIVEAAIDDVRVTVRSCPRSGDFNGSGGTPDDADITAFFAAWNAGHPSADFDGSGGVPDDADVVSFFVAWNRG